MPKIKPGDEVYVLGCRNSLLEGKVIERATNSWVVCIQGNTFRISDTEIFLKTKGADDE